MQEVVGAGAKEGAMCGGGTISSTGNGATWIGEEAICDGGTALSTGDGDGDRWVGGDVFFGWWRPPTIRLKVHDDDTATTAPHKNWRSTKQLLVIFWFGFDCNDINNA